MTDTIEELALRAKLDEIQEQLVPLIDSYIGATVDAAAIERLGIQLQDYLNGLADKEYAHEVFTSAFTWKDLYPTDWFKRCLIAKWRRLCRRPVGFDTPEGMITIKVASIKRVHIPVASGTIVVRTKRD